MKVIISFILGVILTISLTVFAQNSKAVDFIFKPEIPKQVKIGHYYGTEDIPRKIQSNLINGWILKSCSFAITGHGVSGQAIVVYEKY